MLQYLWNLLGIPVRFAAFIAGIEVGSGIDAIARIGVAVLALLIIWTLLKKFIGMFRKKDRLVSIADARAVRSQGVLPTKDTEFTESLEATQHLGNTVEVLRRDKDYEGLGKAYLSVNEFKKAAKWFSKAGDLNQAAACLAKAGLTLRAAKMLLKAGDFVQAGRFFEEKGKHLQAASAYEKGGKHALAAAAYAEARRFDSAVAAYKAFFADPVAPASEQTATAEACHAILESEPGKSRISPDERRELLAPIARQFERSKRYDLAASLYREAGDLVRASEVYVLAGKLPQASECMKQAGREKEAAEISGRFFESRKQWKDAGRAYLAAGNYQRAGACFSNANDPVRAAESYERAEQYYGSGLAYAHAARFEDAIRLLQKVKESDPMFGQARALLGRCFYELHDYAHCAAALDNHLTGKRVEHDNIEYFYMLALAYEQLGKLDESRELMYKIRTVNTAFRDVSQRISNISSRLSMQKDGVIPATIEPGNSGTQPLAAVLKSVENSIGTRYKIERELGRGGMGVVYLARDTQLDRPVALKFLGSLVDHSEEYRQRFVREARTAARISHPNIISIYDISASEGKAYIAMEYVEGTSLFKYIQQKEKLVPREAANIISQVCSALAAIHEAGITHRDIKPDNILLAKAGLVKLMDFGLAKAEDSRMTRTGMVMGTPSYMAPEQVLGKQADQRTDIYALGLVLHECLTGRTTFLDGDVLERQLNEVPPPPSASVEGIPEKMDAIIAKCVAKKPEARYQQAKELLADLRALANEMNS